MPMENSSADTATYPKRGGCLSWFLGVTIVASFIGAIGYVIAGPSFEKQQELPAWTPYVMAITGLLLSISALAAWNWKKAGVIGLCVLSLAVCVINIYIGMGLAWALPGLLGPLVLIVLVVPLWKYFR